MPHPNIRKLDQLSLEATPQGERFESQHAQIAALLGAQKLDYGLLIVPPGKRAWPYHAHLVSQRPRPKGRSL